MEQGGGLLTAKEAAAYLRISPHWPAMSVSRTVPAMVRPVGDITKSMPVLSGGTDTICSAGRVYPGFSAETW